MKIGIIFGGKSVEHEISILSTFQVLPAINHECFLIYVDKENNFFLLDRNTTVKDFKNHNYKKKKICLTKHGFKAYRKHILDLAIIIMHGTNGEDGKMSGLLSLYEIPFVGLSSIYAGVAQDKVFMKQVFEANSIRTLPYKYICENDVVDVYSYKYPLILKPARLGSSIGIQVVKSNDEMKEALQKTFKYDSRVLIEEYIADFREVNCAIMKNINRTIISDLEEVTTHSDILSYDDKYKQKLQKRIIPALLGKRITDEIKELTTKVFKVFGEEGVFRVDFIIIDDTPYVNEVNTIPGSLAYYLFSHSLSEHIDILIKNAIWTKKKDKHIYSHTANILDISAKK